MKSVPVTVISAVKLSSAQLKKIESTVEQKYKGAKIKIETKVDESVIGGVKLVVNSIEYDATVQGKLNKLRSHLIEKL